MNTDRHRFWRQITLVVAAHMCYGATLHGEENNADMAAGSPEVAEKVQREISDSPEITSLDFGAVAFSYPVGFRRDDSKNEATGVSKIELTGRETNVTVSRHPAVSDPRGYSAFVKEAQLAFKTATRKTVEPKVTESSFNDFSLPTVSFEASHPVGGKSFDVSIRVVELGKGLDGSIYTLLIQKQPGSDGSEMAEFQEAVSSTLVLATDAKRTRELKK